MVDSRHEKLAELLVRYSTAVQPGELVAIAGQVAGAPLLRAVYREVVRAGGHPHLELSLDEASESLLTEGSPAQLDWVNPSYVDSIEHADVRIVVTAESNTRSLSRVDPARLARVARAREPVRHRYLERAAAGDLRWVLASFPTNAAAQDAAMSLFEYEEFVYRACLIDHERPADAWRELAQRIERVAAFLQTRSELRVVAQDTDLVLGVGGRTWIPAIGRENFPDGEVFTGPVETSLEGTIRFSYPAVFQKREVDDVRLTFRGGEVVEASAARGQDYLDQMLAIDEGARRAGEFAFGLNDAVRAFTRNILFDEKIGGTVHLALGNSYPETGGLNESGLHWDMICDLRAGSEVYADGELVYRDGSFLPAFV